jgi:hypothetical protein
MRWRGTLEDEKKIDETTSQATQMAMHSAQKVRKQFNKSQKKTEG